MKWLGLPQVLDQAVLSLKAPYSFHDYHLPQSNEWTGKHSFNGQSLHQISSQPNPYEEAASIIARTLAPFDDDNEIPVVGFGDGEHTAARALQKFFTSLWTYGTLLVARCHAAAQLPCN